jgi:hypothetical protein
MPAFLEEKGVPNKFLIPKITDQVFLWYRYGKYQENIDQHQPKVPNCYTTLVNTTEAVPMAKNTTFAK